jgi:hypothetical protein
VQGASGRHTERSAADIGRGDIVRRGELAGLSAKKDVETGEEKPWLLKDLRKTRATYYDEHVPESSIEGNMLNTSRFFKHVNVSRLNSLGDH